MARRTSIRIVSLLSVSMFLLASCAFPPEGQRWVKAGAEEEQIEDAVDSCNARVAFFSLTPFVWSTMVWGKRCMDGRGYDLEPEVASQ